MVMIIFNVPTLGHHNLLKKTKNFNEMSYNETQLRRYARDYVKSHIHAKFVEINQYYFGASHRSGPLLGVITGVKLLIFV